MVDCTGSRKEIHHNWTSPVDCIGWQDQHTTVLKNILVTFSQESGDIYIYYNIYFIIYDTLVHNCDLAEVILTHGYSKRMRSWHFWIRSEHFHAMLWGSRRNRHRSDRTGYRWNSSHHRCNGWLLPWSKSALRPYWIPLPRLGWDG